MLTFRFSPPFITFQTATSFKPTNYPTHTIRYLLFDITSYEIACDTCIRDMLSDLILPPTMVGLPEVYDGTYSEYKFMLSALTWFRQYICEKRDKKKYRKLVTQLTEVIIEVKQDELLVHTDLSDLAKHMEKSCTAYGSKFRTLSENYD